MLCRFLICLFLSLASPLCQAAPSFSASLTPIFDNGSPALVAGQPLYYFDFVASGLPSDAISIAVFSFTDNSPLYVQCSTLPSDVCDQVNPYTLDDGNTINTDFFTQEDSIGTVHYHIAVALPSLPYTDQLYPASFDTSGQGIGYDTVPVSVTETAGSDVMSSSSDGLLQWLLPILGVAAVIIVVFVMSCRFLAWLSTRAKSS